MYNKVMAKSGKIHYAHVPRWAARMYTILAAVIVPWIIYLAIKLPENNLSPHWDAAWVGFDIGLLIMLVMTALLARSRSRMVVMPATVTATMLVVDAWFDSVTARPGNQLYQSVLLAILAELPLAFISFWVAYKTLVKQNTN